jgi:hypothetical protein
MGKEAPSQRSDDELVAAADQRGFWVAGHCYSWTLREALTRASHSDPLDGPGNVRLELDQIARLQRRLGIEPDRGATPASGGGA